MHTCNLITWSLRYLKKIKSLQIYCEADKNICGYFDSCTLSILKCNTVQSPVVVWQSILVQFEVLAEVWYNERDDDTGHDEQQQDGNTWVLHIWAHGEINRMDVQQHVVSVGSICTACGVSHILHAQHQVDVVSERPEKYQGKFLKLLKICLQFTHP